MINATVQPSIQLELQPSQAPEAPPVGGITELVLTHNAPEQTQLLLPMVAHLSRTQSSRWLTWIGPGHIDRALLERYGVDPSTVRVIHASEKQDNRWILWEALARGNSHTVIASPGQLTDRELKALEAAALKGQCQGLLLRIR